ncbi:hypothetical protein BSM4216_2359 [Bacillus smithii]|nr:hypothetical protein BSM4216_2359 [Bacillus smithii]
MTNDKNSLFPFIRSVISKAISHSADFICKSRIRYTSNSGCSVISYHFLKQEEENSLIQKESPE